MSRQYTKRDESYWNKMSQPRTQPVVEETTWAAPIYSEPEDCGDPFYTKASVAYGSTRTADTDTPSSSRVNRATIRPTNDKFSQIRQLELPYKSKNGCLDIQDAINLTKKAYTHVSAFKNAIDLMSEFSNTDLYVRGGNKASRDFISAWLKRIGAWRLKKHYFLEYF